MANQRREAVTYRRFRAQPLLAEGLLGVSRDDGSLERKTAQALAHVADKFGEKADREAMLAGQRQGQIDAMAGGPGEATVPGRDGSHRVYTGTDIEQAKALLRDEEGFRDTPYYDVTAHRVGYGSDTTTRADGRSVPVTPGMRITRDDAERDLDYRLSMREGAQVRRQLGDAWNSLPANARAALYSVGYNYGSLPQPVVAAARTGDLGQIAAAVRALPENPKRREREAGLISGAAGSGAGSPAANGPVTVRAAGTFRPTGRDTIYGRAYDVAGTKTYLQELELTMLQDQDQVFERYKDDPVMLEKAYGELLQAHMGEHVFAEIAPDYQNAFKRRAYSMVEKARGEAEQRREQQDRSNFLSRIDDMENAKSRTMAGMDFSSDTAEAELAKLQGSIDEHYDSAVARDILTPAEAERAKKASRSDMLTGFYTRQAATMNAGEIATMRADMTKDYADGKLDVSADDWTRIESGLISAEKARKTQDEKADKDLEARGKDLARRVARGLPVAPEELARFQLDASTAPKGSEIVGSTLTRMKVSEAIRTLPIGEVEKRLQSILGDSATADDIDFARETIASHRKELQSDPIGVAERFGVLPVSSGLPLDERADPDSVSGAFAERINQAEAAARHFGVSPRYFRPGEAEQIEQAVSQDPARGVAIAAGLVDAAGRDAQSVLKQLGETAPAVSGAGEIMAIGGDPKAARDLLAGYGSPPDGKSYPDMKVTKRVPEAQKIAGEALAFSPDQINRLDEQAAAIARKRLYDAGIDPKSDDAKPVYRRAFQEAAGASFIGNVQFGGFAGYDRGWNYWEKTVLVPPTMRADKFGDVIAALTDGDVSAVKAKNGKSWTAKDFQKAMPVAIAGGYVFALGDPASASPMFIADENGNPVVLDLANMDGLKARVPEAWR